MVSMVTQLANKAPTDQFWCSSLATNVKKRINLILPYTYEVPVMLLVLKSSPFIMYGREYIIEGGREY